MVFLFTFTSFGVVQMLGGPSFATLEVEIYRQTAQLLDLPVAAVLIDAAVRDRSPPLLAFARLDRRRRGSPR